MRRVTALALLSLFLLAGKVQAAEKTSRAIAIENGRLVATRQCSQCHAIGKSGKSPKQNAPAFRTILSRYRGDVLEQELGQNIKIGHTEMPDFQIKPAAVGDLLAYLKSIQQRP